jgi:pyruvate dehydrogenase E2 component (dihydrolipoamide acetyltransferase)
MPTEILMPALSPTMEEGTLAKWLVKEGDTVSSGDLLAEIETDKATMEFEAVDEGVIGKILVLEGTEGVKVNAPIAVLLAEGESASEMGAAKPAAPAPKAAETGTETAAPAAAAGKSHPCPGGPCPLRTAAGSSPRRLRAASPRTRGLTCRRSRARAPMGASSRPM